MDEGLYVKYPLFLWDFWWNLTFLDRFSKKYSDIKFNQNLSNGGGVVLCGQVERHNEDNGRFSQIFKRA
jgi:hypothetical protein